MKKAVVLLSGGLDSSTTLFMAKQQGYECYALSFDYGQRHVAELEAAKKIAIEAGVIAHQIVSLNLGQFGGSALTDNALSVPENNPLDSTEIPITYVPARNTVFLSIALGYAETIGATDIFIGVTAVDYSGYPDCRPEYIAAFERMANLATKSAIEGNKVSIRTPLIDLSKSEIIKKGIALSVPYNLTVSCYQADANGGACGVCDSCLHRSQGFQQAGSPDLTNYA